MHFESTGNNRTIVRFVMDYEPRGGRVSAMASKLIGESPDEQVRADLARLKALFE